MAPNVCSCKLLYTNVGTKTGQSGGGKRRSPEMKVFISWSGERSKAVAHALHDLLPIVLHYVEPWLSEADIPAGDRWADAVAKELEASKFGIICLTPENMNAPWVLFEAGALAKSMQESRVIPLLLDLDFGDITGPLAQFQAKKVDRSGVREVVNSINETAEKDAAEKAVLESRVQELFDLAWPKFETAVAAIPTPSADDTPTPSAPATPTRDQPEILEDLVASVRALDARIRESSEASPGGVRYLGGSGWVRIPREPIDQLLDIDQFIDNLRSLAPNDLIKILYIAEVFVKTKPDLYLMGLKAYEAAKHDDFRAAAPLLQDFRNSVFAALQTRTRVSRLGLTPATVTLIRHELAEFYARYARLELQSEDAAAGDQDGEDESPPE